MKQGTGWSGDHGGPVRGAIWLALALLSACGSGVDPDAVVDDGDAGPGPRDGGADADARVPDASAAGLLPRVREGLGRPPITFDGGRAPDAPVGPTLRIGVPTGEREAATFTPLRSGGDIPLETFGQGATHGVFMVEVTGLGPRTWIDLTLHNLSAGDTPADASIPRDVESFDRGEPEPLECEGEGEQSRCVRGPFIILTTGLAEPADIPDLHVEVRGSAVNEDGLAAEARTDGYFRWTSAGFDPPG